MTNHGGWMGWAALGLLVGCGTLPDAPDAMVEQPDAAVFGEMTVHVVDGFGDPVPGAQVVIADSEGTAYDEEATSQDGSATFAITRGDIVHVGFMDDAAGESRLYSILSVAPDDEVTLNQRPSLAVPEAIGVFDVNGSAPATLTGLFASNGCVETTGAPPWRLQVRPDCVDANGQLNLVARGLDPAAGQDLYLVLLGKEPPNPIVDVVAEDWKPGTGFEIGMSNVAGAWLGSIAGLALVHEGVAYERYSQLHVADQVGEPYAFHHAEQDAYPELLGEYVFGLLAGTEAAPDGVLLFVGKDFDVPGAEIDLDFDEALPRLYQAALAITSFSWMSEGSETQNDNLEAADALYLLARWGLKGPRGTWVVLAPPDVGSPLELDISELADFAPLPEAQTVRVQAFDLDVADGYDAAKTLFGASPDGDFGDRLPTYRGTASFSGSLK